jgi:dipeptidase
LENPKNSISSKNINLLDKPEVEVVYSYDVISYAKEHGYYQGDDKDFCFSDVYNPITFDGLDSAMLEFGHSSTMLTEIWVRYWDYAKGENLKNRMPLYIKPDRKLTPQDLQSFKRDHLEGTELDMSKDAGAGSSKLPYRWRPLTWNVDGKTYFHERLQPHSKPASPLLPK